jgi:hypothetical protein
MSFLSRPSEMPYIFAIMPAFLCAFWGEVEVRRMRRGERMGYEDLGDIFVEAGKAMQGVSGNDERSEGHEGGGLA